jgi:bacteriocin biosynthesis cyclodehydratase domain-containing protein
VDVVPGEGAFVLTGSQQTVLKGRLYEEIVPCIGGGRTADDLCEQLDGRVSPAEVYFVLGQLEKKGYLCEELDGLPAAEAALWSAHKLDPTDAARRLAAGTVSVHSHGIDPAPLAAMLDALRIRTATQGDLDIVLTDNALRAELDAHNRRALTTGTPWLLVRPVGQEMWIGPLFRPGVTGCWGCLADRLRSNSPVETYLNARHGSNGAAAAPVASSAATLAVAAGLAANAAASWLARGGDLPALEGKLQSFDAVTWRTATHTLVRLPYCRACADARGASSGGVQPIVLAPRAKTFTHDGGHRVVAPEVTLERYGHHVSPITGAVTMLERVSRNGDGDGALNVYLAGHNLARRHRDLSHLRFDLRNMSSGKGASDVQARASGLCEGLERYSGVFRGDEPRRAARLADLGDAAIHPHDLLLFSERQYRERDTWNARRSHFNYVPVPFDPGATVEWTPAWSLTRNEPRYLPTSFCYFNYPHGDGPPFCVACSNGNAAGNTREEAILQGFLELVERECVALWWYSRVRRPGVALDRFDDGYLSRVRHVLAGRGRVLWALDLTADWGIPVFAALSREPDRMPERIVMGFGAHLDPRVALLRAVTEMNQMLSNLPGDQDRRAGDEATDEETLHWLRTATAANQPYLLPADDVPPRTPAAYHAAWSEDLTADVRACQALVEAQGLELLVLDQTRAEIGLPVAKVIVPGMRHFWARFAPGRLYDVPVRLGWLERPLPEDALNPIPMFL